MPSVSSPWLSGSSQWLRSSLQSMREPKQSVAIHGHGFSDSGCQSYGSYSDAVRTLPLLHRHLTTLRQVQSHSSQDVLSWPGCTSIIRIPSLQSASSLHDQMVEGVIKEAPSLPKQINEVTMLTHERVEGSNMIYTYELTGDGEMPDQADATDNTCKLAVLRDLIRAGVILRFEYNKAGKRLLGELEINSCPSTMASVTTNQHHSSIDVVIDGSRALAPLKVGSLSIYATVDTGCADMTMIKTNADKLLANGEATKREDYAAILADGSQRTMPAIVIKTLTIGSHTIHNVTASVVPDGTMMLLGYNILNQVSGKFAINTTKSTLDFD